jgi:hypothetical protein
MERMFAAMGNLYAERWGEFFHFALFEEGDKPEDRDAAFERTHEKVRPNWELGYRRAVEGIREFTPTRAARLLWRDLPLGAEGVRLLKEQFLAALYIKAGFDAGFLRYTYFLAEKG